MKSSVSTDSAGLLNSASASEHLVLAGGGHSHARLLQRWGMAPKKRPQGRITLVSTSSASLYSGMVPAYCATLDSRRQLSIDIRWLAQQANVDFIQAEIIGITPRGELHLNKRPSLSFDRLSLNVGAITNRQHFQQAISIKPLDAALAAITQQDERVAAASAAPCHLVGAGLAGIELAFALRNRWPTRRLVLHAKPDALQIGVVQHLHQADITISSEPAPDTANTLLCTGSLAPPWLKASGLPCDDQGRVKTDAKLQVLGHPWILAAGDCAVIESYQRPASGVWAVRAANPLAHNLERLNQRKQARPWRPQQRALQLLGCPMPGQAPSAWLIWGPLWAGPHPWLWRWKRHLDQRFMRMLQSRGSMERVTTSTAGAQSMPCRGCAAKLPADPLQQALQRCGVGELGQHPEDAHALATTGDGKTLLSSVDGFPALIPDAWLNGRLTALHACSDLWASGARVSTAQAIVTVPAIDSPSQVELLSQTLAGIRSALEEQGAQLIGGHTMESRQPAAIPSALDLQLSLSVNGETPQGATPWSKGPIQAGDVVLLSRRLGSGVLFAAAMQGRCDPLHLDRCLDELSNSQHSWVEALRQLETEMAGSIHACTDVTGFGLLGHLNEMLAASGAITLDLWLDQIPSFDGALELLRAGIASTLAPSNRQALTSLGCRVNAIQRSNNVHAGLDPGLEALLVDPQTCGPLLVSCSGCAARILEQQGWTAVGHAYQCA
ncbi:MAG: selenide, water dikinase SelD [Synechococcus sp.]